MTPHVTPDFLLLMLTALMAATMLIVVRMNKLAARLRDVEESADSLHRMRQSDYVINMRHKGTTSGQISGKYK